MSLYDDASLVMIPSGYKDGKLYSVKPSDGAGDFTFSRGSNLAATRVDENGLIEKGRENLILQSNQFDTTWVTGGLSETSGQIGYDGSSDAWLVENIADGSRFMTQTGLGLGVATCSIYAKAGTTDWIYFNNGLGVSAYYDLTNGALGTTSGVIDANIESIGSGWYRCSMTASSMNEVRYYLADSDNSLPTSIGDNVYFQDAQVEQGLVATDYIETGATTAQAGILEDMPRLDYSGGTCPALLLEPQRSNLIINSEYFGNYNKSGSITLTHNYGTSPDGLQNSTRMQVPDSSNYYILSNSVSATAGTYVISVYIKGTSGEKVQLYNDGTAGGGGFTECTLTGDWKRFERVVTATATGGLNPHIVFGFGVSPNAQDIEVWGWQCEAGSYPTSYIPTYGTSVTRGADSCVKTGISSLIGQTEGTLFVEVDLTKVPLENRRFLAIGDGTLSNRIGIGQQSGTSLESFVVASGSLQAIFTQSGTTAQVYKIAIAYAANDFVMYIDGSQVGTDTSGSVPSTSNVYVGVSEITPTTTQISDGINQAILFPTRLSNTELAALTTP